MCRRRIELNTGILYMLIILLLAGIRLIKGFKNESGLIQVKRK
jgi:hypothetical protein